MPPARVLSASAALVRTGVIAGVIVAALLYPLVVVAGLGAKRGAQQISGSLDALQIAPLSQVSKIYASDGATLITQFYEEYRIPTPLAAISPYVQQAIVAAEDNRFFEHNGVDMRGIARAFVANQHAGGVSQGASTITMQYVRMSLRDSAGTPAEVLDATERTPSRKLREMRIALDLEKTLTKQQILERYLNAAYFGHRAYGIGAAAEVYFSKTPAALTPAEAATLAGLVQAPSSYDPAGTDQTGARARRDYVLERMVALDYLSAGDGFEAQSQPITLHLHEPPNDCIDVAAAHNDWAYFCDLFKTWWMAQPEYGTAAGERLDKLRRGGYTIITSLDVRAQAAAVRQVLAKEKVGSSYAVGIVAVEPGTGRVRSMAVNRTYSLDQSRNGPHADPRKRKTGLRGNYPATVNPLLGGGNLPGYQAGSTFKMFTMLAALETGLPLSTEINAPQRYQSKFKTEWNSPTRCNGSYWCPVNASASMTGRHSMWAGFGKSVNTYFVQLEEKVGPEAAVRMAERLGLKWHTDIDRTQATPQKAKSWGAFTLGVADTTPLEMAEAYATVAGDGMYCEPLPVMAIKPFVDPTMMQPAGPVPAASASAPPSPVAPTVGANPVTPRCRRAVSADVARGALDAARCVTGYGAATGDCGGWATAPGVYRTVGRPVAGKTGTTDDNRSVWFIGMTPGLTAAGFIADPDNPFHTVSDGDHNKARDAVAAMMKETLAGTPVLNFTAPSPTISGKSAKAPAKRPRLQAPPVTVPQQPGVTGIPPTRVQPGQPTPGRVPPGRVPTPGRVPPPGQVPPGRR